MNHFYNIVKVCTFLILPVYGYGQINQAEMLVHLKQEVARIERRIQNESDTLKSLRTQIEILEDQHLTLKFGSSGDDMSLPTTLKMDGKIRKSSDPISDVIKYVNKNDTVRLKGYQDNYWIVSSGGFYGYLSEIYVHESQDVLFFKNTLIRRGKVQGSSSQQVEESSTGRSNSYEPSTYTGTYRSSASNSIIHTGPKGWKVLHKFKWQQNLY